MTDWSAMELKWRARWKGTEIALVDPSKKKKFITVAYPYPNSPQHIGHGRTYTLADVHARFERMRGNNVLFPMAFHYTGTPILGMAARVEAQDYELIKNLSELFDVPKDVIPSFADPVQIASYFHKEIKLGMIEMGYSIDWSGEFTTIDPAYKKFIAWQIRLLRERGMIVQGSHPVGWCTRDKNPVSQHDTLGDVEPDFIEYVIIRAELDDGRILPAATMRAETIYGVTNMWVNPEMDYHSIKVGGKTWLASLECAQKLEHLACDAQTLDKPIIKGLELVGKTVTIPGILRTVPVLPAKFVRATTGTGAVMSVPAHAPYDYQALEDLKKHPSGESTKIAKEIVPISILSSDDSSMSPAQKIVSESGITDQNDERLDELTKKIYADEYYNSTMLDNTDKLAGMKASEAKIAAATWIASIQTDKPQIMYEFSNAPIYCRCGTQCVVHVLANQWFLDYSNSEWKGIARKCLEQVEIIPNEMRTEFDHVFEWLHERACARQMGLGTCLPWDKGWIVESLSDSVIYMAYYVISRFINEQQIKAELLDDDFFNYIFFGSGDIEAIASKCNSDTSTLGKIRDTFTYFYPVDSRHSGRDLVPNHLSFFIFNHSIIFPKEHWPRQIVVNGSVLMDKKKMSKSMNNIIPLRQAVRKYGADPIRVAILLSAELLQDSDFKLELVHSASSRLESMLNECTRVAHLDAHDEKSNADQWLGARIRELSTEIEQLLVKMRLREALGKIFSDFDSAISWYMNRNNSSTNPNSQTLHDAWSARVALLSPFAPHVSDEMWEILGNDGMASGSMWPNTIHDDDSMLLCSESLLESVMNDITSILDLTKIKPTKIILYTANNEKLDAYLTMLVSSEAGATDMSSMMRILGDSEKTVKIRHNADFVKRALADIQSTTSRDKKIRLGAKGLDESQLYSTALADILQDELGVDLLVYSESDPNIDDPKNKARMARPFKPAILII